MEKSPDGNRLAANGPKFLRDVVTTSTPKRGKCVVISGNSFDIVDRYIPQQTSRRAYNAAQRLKTIDFEAPGLSNMSLSPPYLASPSFFTNLRFTRHYNSIRSVNDDRTTTKKDEKRPIKQRLHRQYIADALGFHIVDRVYRFSATDSSISSVNSLMSESLATNHSSVDPMLSILPPAKVIQYLAAQAFSNSLKSKSLVPVNQRSSKRIKSNVPYRVLDAPSLRNDFYSNLVSWSPTSGNIVVGLGCSVYIWSDTKGAINVLHYTYLQPSNDIVTCVSFSPYDELLLVGTKQGKLLLFDQHDEVNKSTDGSFKPLCISSDSTIKGICCIEWFKNANKKLILVGQESGDVHVIEVEFIIEEIFEIMPRGVDKVPDFYTIHSTPGNDKYNIRSSRTASIRTKKVLKYDRSTVLKHKWGLTSISKFKAQNQQVCGLSFNEKTDQLAIGGNDNSCTIWDVTDLISPQLQFVLPHKAAVKAVAFCPWSRSLLATGGGSKDRTIRFWHTRSGTLLQQVKAPGQITSLIWSIRQKQIVATFGFGDLEKPTLVTVYSYPSLEPLTEVHSSTALRVLSAVPSPDFSSICVATNDETVRFYELWNSQHSTITEAQQKGVYGSDLIEFSEGIDKNDEIIR